MTHTYKDTLNLGLSLIFFLFQKFFLNNNNKKNLGDKWCKLTHGSLSHHPTTSKYTKRNSKAMTPNKRKSSTGLSDP